MQKSIALAFLLTVIAPQIALAQLLPRFTRTKEVCCLSSRYDWAHSRLSAPASALSFSALDVSFRDVAGESAFVTPSVPATTYQGKTFQMGQANLTNGHCRLSEVAMMIDEHGRYTIDLLAEQNPKLLAREQQSIAMADDRNRFVVSVRPLVGGTASVNTGSNLAVAPTAAVVEIEFWLERGQYQRIHHVSAANSLAVARAFKAIDRVAFDLRYE